MDDNPDFSRFDDCIQVLQPDQIVSQTSTEKGIILQDRQDIRLQVSVVDADILHIRFLPPFAAPPSVDYVRAASFPVSDVPWEITETETGCQIRTSVATLRILRMGMRISLVTTDGKVLMEDQRAFQQTESQQHGIQQIRTLKRLMEGARCWGLGDKSGPLLLNGQQLQQWNTDAFGFGAQTDPLYRSIPFFLAWDGETAIGFLLDNTHRSYFHFGESLSLGMEGGQLAYYLFVADDPEAIVRRYTQLTGLPPLPPLWALGFHQCRWSYYPESRVRELAHTFREHSIPCDALYLDIDYMNGYRCFTWNRDYFPDPASLIHDLKEQGFHTVVMIDPGIKAERGYSVFDEGLEKELFCKRVDGQLFTGPVWPGPCAFPDYTRPDTRQWWGSLYKELYVDQGVSGFWNDMNEPAVFRVNSLTFPEDVQHHYEGQGAAHSEVHNVYGMQMSRATQEGLRKLRPEKRPFVLTRATFAGGQRYAAVWTGDNTASWEHLAIANRQCIRLSLSGFSFCGSDIGGFVDKPSGELMVRWLQLGAFHPLFRVHSIGNHEDGAKEVEEGTVAEAETNDRLDQEPWSFGDPYTDAARKAIEWRYRLLPYVYTCFEQYSCNGDPVLRPLALEAPADPMACKREREFLFGKKLLISPVLIPGQREQAVYLPSGNWYHYHDNTRYSGGGFVRIPCPLDQLPILVKAGTVLPEYPVRAHTAEPIDRLILNLYFAEGTFYSEGYEDAGEGYDQEKEGFLKHRWTLRGSTDSLELDWHTTGAFTPLYEQVEIRLVGLPFHLDTLTIDGEKVQLSPNEKAVIHKTGSRFKSLRVLGSV